MVLDIHPKIGRILVKKQLLKEFNVERDHLEPFIFYRLEKNVSLDDIKKEIEIAMKIKLN